MCAHRSSQSSPYPQETQRQSSVPCRRWSQRFDERPSTKNKGKWKTKPSTATQSTQNETNKKSHGSGHTDRKVTTKDLNQQDTMKYDRTSTLEEEVQNLKQAISELLPKMDNMETIHKDLVPRIERMESVVSTKLNAEDLHRENSCQTDAETVSFDEDTQVKEVIGSSLNEATSAEPPNNESGPSQSPSPVRTTSKNANKKEELAGHWTGSSPDCNVSKEPMTEDQKKVLRENRLYLIHELEITNGNLLEYFHQEGILELPHLQLVKAQVTDKEKVVTFLDLITKRGSRAFDKLLEFLSSEDGQKHVAEHLENKLKGKVACRSEVRLPFGDAEKFESFLQSCIENFRQDVVKLIVTYATIPRIGLGSIVFTLEFASVSQLDEYWMVMNNPHYRDGLMKQLIDLVMTDEIRQATAANPLNPAMAEMTMNFKEYMKIRRELTKGYNLQVRTSECVGSKKRATTNTTQNVLHLLEHTPYNRRAVRIYCQRKSRVPLVDDTQRVVTLTRMLQEKQHMIDEKESKIRRLVEDHVDKEMGFKRRITEMEKLESDHQQEVSRLKQGLDIEKAFAQEYKAEKDKLEEESQSFSARVESLEKELDEKNVELVQLRNNLNLTKQRSDGQIDKLSHENRKLKENVIELQKSLDHHAKLAAEPLAVEKQLQIEMKHKETDFCATLEKKDADIAELRHQLESEREDAIGKIRETEEFQLQITHLVKEIEMYKRLQSTNTKISDSKPPSYEETMGANSAGSYAVLPEVARSNPQRMTVPSITPREVDVNVNTGPHQAPYSREPSTKGLDIQMKTSESGAAASALELLEPSPSVNSKRSDSPTLPKLTNESLGEKPTLQGIRASAAQQDIGGKVRFERPDTGECAKSRELDTVFCIDCSESMGDEGLTHVKQAFMALIDDIQYTAQIYGLEENIGIVTFGGTADRVQSLTCDYKRLRRIPNIFAPRGGTPMVEAITEAQKEVAENGGKLRLSNRKVPSRIVVFTDGYPHNDDIVIDDRSKSQSARMRVMSAVCVFAKNPQKRSVAKMRVDFVACGNEYEETFLKSLASNGSGVYARYDDAVTLKQISGYYRWNYYASRFAGPFRVKAHIRDLVPDKSSFKNWMISNDTGERNLLDLDDPFELEECYKVVMAIAKEEGGDQEEEDDDIRSPSLNLNIPLGSRVVYAGDEKNNPKHRGTGTVVKHHKDDSVTVEWDLSGSQHRYDFGRNMKYEVMTTTDPRVVDPNDPFLKVGVQVERGQDWKWSNQDGGSGNVGTVYKVEDSGHVYVRWPNGHCNAYRHGAGGKYDLRLVVARQSSPTASLPLEQAADAGHVWQKFDEDSDCFRQFDEDVCLMLEILFNDNRKGCTDIEIDGEQYTLNFEKMEASNKNRTITVNRTVRGQEANSAMSTGFQTKSSDIEPEIGNVAAGASDKVVEDLKKPLPTNEDNSVENVLNPKLPQLPNMDVPLD